MTKEELLHSIYSELGIKKNCYLEYVYVSGKTTIHDDIGYYLCRPLYIGDILEFISKYTLKEIDITGDKHYMTVSRYFIEIIILRDNYNDKLDNQKKELLQFIYNFIYSLSKDESI